MGWGSSLLLLFLLVLCWMVRTRSLLFSPSSTFVFLELCFIVSRWKKRWETVSHALSLRDTSHPTHRGRNFIWNKMLLWPNERSKRFNSNEKPNITPRIKPDSSKEIWLHLEKHFDRKRNLISSRERTSFISGCKLHFNLTRKMEMKDSISWWE